MEPEMPRLKNKGHELYCYARVYHNMPKIRAVEFAGYSPYPMSYKRIEDRPEVQERLKEMEATPQETLYDADAPPAPDFVMRHERINDIREDGVTYKWLMNELNTNLKLAREAGKFKEANEAIKLMGGLYKLVMEEEEADPITKRALAAGIDLHAIGARKNQISQEPQKSPDVGDDARKRTEAESFDFDILSPSDIEDDDGDDRD